MSWWDKVWYDRVKDWMVVRLDAAQVPDGMEPRVIEPDSRYVTFRLKSARLVNVRKGLRKFYGVVHSTVSIPHRMGQPAVFQHVTSPDALKSVDAENIDRVVTMDLQIAGPVPYRGGNVEIEAGLFSIAATDLAAPFIGLLEELSKVAGCSAANAALPFIGPIKKGVEALIGTCNKSVLEIGLLQQQAPLHSGWLAVLRAEQGELNVQTLRVSENGFRLQNEHGEPLIEVPYMLFQIVSSSTNDTWFNIPEIAEAYDEVRNAVLAGNADETEVALSFFRRVTRMSPELLPSHAKRLYEQVDKDVREAIDDETPEASDEPIFRSPLQSLAIP